MTTHKPFQLGSISTGTLKTEDLITNLMHSVEDSSMLGAQWSGHGEEDLQVLIDVLQDQCPLFVYFGAHPGDGADFGFWADFDSLEEEMRYQGEPVPCDCNSTSVITPAHWYGENPDCAQMDETQKHLTESNVIVQVNDHGNVTVMDMDRNELWSCV